LNKSKSGKEMQIKHNWADIPHQQPKNPNLLVRLNWVIIKLHFSLLMQCLLIAKKSKEIVERIKIRLIWHLVRKVGLGAI